MVPCSETACCIAGKRVRCVPILVTRRWTSTSDSSKIPRVDLYATLGVERDARREQLREAYRRAAKESHPDMNPGDPVAALRFREVNAAHQTLLNDSLRRIHDMQLRRSDAQIRLEKLKEEDLKTLRGRLRARPLLVVSLLGAVSCTLQAVIMWRSALGDPQMFWTGYSYVPSWFPWKWEIAEFYAKARSRRGLAPE
mmetsp:Transcript_41967/g.111096  ORF Transcript_41967/g.111096 Transcript_41967/m.111096 type:complete len:197 (-) Transcript_41967:48-638(-)